MRTPIFHIDAFTTRPFAGNPAAVMLMDRFPEDTVRGELDRNELKPLPLRDGSERWAELYFVYTDRDYAGRGALRLADIIREKVSEQCRELSPKADS